MQGEPAQYSGVTWTVCRRNLDSMQEEPGQYAGEPGQYAGGTWTAYRGNLDSIQGEPEQYTLQTWKINRLNQTKYTW